MRPLHPTPLRLLLCGLGLLAEVTAWAAPDPLLWAEKAPLASYCDRAGQLRPAPPLRFVLPRGTGAQIERPAPCAADGSAPSLLSNEAATALFGGPLEEGMRRLALYGDGRRVPVEVIGVVAGGGAALVLGQPACEPAPAVAPDGGVPDGGDGTTDGGAGACATLAAATDGLLGLLLLPAVSTAAPRLLSPESLSGVVRRRIGRQSLPARGHLVGPGFSIAAVFKRRGDTIQLAIFGEDGGLRLYQSVPWRKGTRAMGKPVAVHLVPDFDGAEKDGLLVVGAGDGGPLHLLLGFAGRTVKAYP